MHMHICLVLSMHIPALLSTISFMQLVVPIGHKMAEGPVVEFTMHFVSSLLCLAESTTAVWCLRTYYLDGY